MEECKLSGTQEELNILAGLIDLEVKVEACRLLRLKFIQIWDTLVSSYETMMMKAKYQ